MDIEQALAEIGGKRWEDKEPRKYGDGGRPQSAGTMANSGDAGEGGRG